MNILDSILEAQGGNTTQQLGQQFGLNQDQVSTALSVLVPALAVGFNKNMSNPGAPGADGLFGLLAPMLDSNRDGSMVDDVIGMLGRFVSR